MDILYIRIVRTVYLMARVMGTTTLSLNNYLNLSHYIPEVYEGCQVGGGGGLCWREWEDLMEGEKKEFYWDGTSV